MEYVALVVWLGLCLGLGWLVHCVTDGAMLYRPVRALAVPGVAVRKLTMAVTALVAGGRVTGANLYDLSDGDVQFDAEGPSGVTKVLVPLAPLFGCAIALSALNELVGRPLQLAYTIPTFSAFDAEGLRGFLTATWELLSSTVRHFMAQGWREPGSYVLFALTFSLAFGASCKSERLKECAMGAGVLGVFLALTAAVSARHVAPGVMTHPAWFTTMRDFLLGTSAVAFVMMVHGMLGALVVGIGVRLYELAGRRGSAETSSQDSPPKRKGRRRAA